MKLKRYIAVMLAVIVVCLSGCSRAIIKWYDTENAPVQVYKNTLDNGDSFYTPEGSHVASDDDRTILYFNNLLIAYTTDDLSDERSDSIASRVNGETVGVVSGGIHCIQIKTEESTLDELEQKAEILMQDDDVLYACPEYPVQIMGATEEYDESVEYSVDLWWQDVLGLDIAWNYSNYCGDINVGVVDTGFYVEHSEFADRIITVGDNNSNLDEHGNHVLGIMAAADDEKGIRGIADNAMYYCADLWHDSMADDSFHTIGELMAVYNYMAQNDVRVVNNSWGCYLFDKKYYNKLEFGNDMKYDEWLYKRVNEDIIPTAVATTVMMGQLIDSGYENLIFVQAAGNGYYPSGTPVDAITGGYFSSITEDTFSEMSDKIINYFDERNITYNDIDDRILIVGASSEYINENGDFHPAEFSNFGDTVDIFAPGVMIYSCVSPSASDYTYMSGTSMAAPMVTGAVAFLWSLDMDMSVEQVRELILTGTLNKVCVEVQSEAYYYPLLDVGFATEILMMQ